MKAALLAAVLASSSVLAEPPSRDIGGARVVVPLSHAICAYRAVLFAAQTYDDPAYPDLRTPVADIHQVGEVLEHHFGFEVQRFPEATRATIIDTLDRLVDETRPCEAVVVYYAGHGTLREAMGRGFWHPTDARASTSSWVAHQEVVDRLEAVRAKHVLLFVDSCFSGTLLRENTRAGRSQRPPLTSAAAVRDLLRHRSRWVVTSGGEELVQDAFEDEGVSVFAYFLTRLLRERDEEWLAVDEIFPRLRQLVMANASQSPRQGALPGHRGGQLALRKDGAAASSAPDSPIVVAPSGVVRRDAGLLGRWVEPGTFVMGHPSTSSSRSAPRPGERARRVTQSGFWIMETEVTRGIWETITGSAPPGRDCGPACPVQGVSWFDAIAFANAASDAEGRPRAYGIVGDEITWRRGAGGYRLPTEAEWERAARHDRPEAAFAGGDDAAAVGHLRGASGPQEVCGKQRNPLSLCDMTGNVAEWTWDRFDPMHDPRSGAEDPVSMPVRGGSLARVIRGGHWRSPPAESRVWSRNYLEASERSEFVGFRLVRSER